MAKYVAGQEYKPGDLIDPFGPNEIGANYSGPKTITLGQADLDFQAKLRDLEAKNDRAGLYALIGVNSTGKSPDFRDQFNNPLYLYDARGNNPNAPGGQIGRASCRER